MTLITSLVLAALLAGPEQNMPKPTLYYIPHTHWEGAVFLTREEYLDEGLEHILQALRLMERYPEYKFALDQVAYFKPFLERYPEQAAKFRKYVAEGRLELVGGMDVMPDDVKIGGELLVRQIQYGKGYCREALGLDIDVAWLLDTFGHSPQLPQFLKLGGFKSFWFCRGAPTDDGPAEFLLKGIDGSTIPAMRLPGWYGQFFEPPRDQKGFDKFFTDGFNGLAATAGGPERVGLAGADVSEPEDYVTPLVRAFNKKPDAPFTIRYSVPSEFAKVVAKRKDVPVESYDLNPIFPGTYSSRVELRQTAKALETKLLNVEQLSALCNWAGSATDDTHLWQAWEPVLFNQAHDLASGTLNDHVYHDTVKSYGFSERLAGEMLSARWGSIEKQIDTSGPGSPVIVYNPQGWVRTDLAQTDLFFADTGVTGLKIADASGGQVPFQITSVKRYGDNALMRVKLAFLAKDVPACGYATYHVVPTSGEVKEGEETGGAPGTLENEFYKVTVDTRTGAITSVIDKGLGAEVLSAPANIVARKDDHGDLWALYKTLNGIEHLPNMEHQPVPNSSTAMLSTAFGEKEGATWHGPVYSEFTVSHAFGAGRFSTRIWLTRGVRRIDIETELVNKDKHVRYQVLFPTAISGGKNVQEIPFGAIERPMGVEFPANNWVDYGNGERGVGLVNAAMPGNLVTDGTMMLSLMRSVNLGDYNGGDTSDTGYELDTPRTLRYALVPHGGDWRQARLSQAGQEFNSPLLAFKAEPHKGSLPSSWGLLQIAEPNVVVTSVRPGPDQTQIVRLYESWGKAMHGVAVKLNAKVLAASEANLLEDTTGKLPVSGNAVMIDLHPFEIKTLKLRLATGRRP
ncbi:MAG: alpha-mannosidase [Fimbriimonadales bacterium]